MIKTFLASLAICSLFAITSAQAEATLSFSPAQTSFQFDASGNLTLTLVPDAVVTTASTCRMKFLLATKKAPLNNGKIKNAATAPEGALTLFSVSTPAGLPNSQLSAVTTGLSSMPNKGSVYGRAALQCGTKKKTFVFSPIVSFDYSLISAAKKKAVPQVAREWKTKVLTSFP